MSEEFLTWFSIVSLSLNVVLLIAGVGLFVANWKASKKNKSQVKIWMEQANGVQFGLQRIIDDKWTGLYTSVNDVTNAIWAVHASAFSLYQSLYEERVLTEDEYIEEQSETREEVKKMLKNQSSQKDTSIDK